MIKLKLTKEKFITVINVITGITQQLRAYHGSLKYDITRMQANAHLYILDDLSRKMRSKLIMIEDKYNDHQFTFSINEMQALVFHVNTGICTHTPYATAIIQEISVPICKRLLE